VVECQDFYTLTEAISLTHDGQRQQITHPDISSGLIESTSTGQFSFRQSSKKKENKI